MFIHSIPMIIAMGLMNIVPVSTNTNNGFFIHSSLNTFPMCPVARKACMFTPAITAMTLQMQMSLMKGIHGAHFSVNIKITNLSAMADVPKSIGNKMNVLVLIARLSARLTADISS